MSPLWLRPWEFTHPSLHIAWSLHSPVRISFRGVRISRDDRGECKWVGRGNISLDRILRQTKYLQTCADLCISPKKSEKLIKLKAVGAGRVGKMFIMKCFNVLLLYVNLNNAVRNLPDLERPIGGGGGGGCQSKFLLAHHASLWGVFLHNLMGVPSSRMGGKTPHLLMLCMWPSCTIFINRGQFFLDGGGANLTFSRLYTSLGNISPLSNEGSQTHNVPTAVLINRRPCRWRFSFISAEF